MGNNKTLIAGIAGGVMFFLLGWLVYGVMLKDFMAANAGSATGVNKPMEEFSFGWLFIGNLASGFLLAIIFGSYANITTAMAGAKAGAVIGFLMGLGFDSVMYATANLMNMKGMWTDIIAWTVMCAITGAAIAAILGMKGKAATS